MRRIRGTAGRYEHPASWEYRSETAPGALDPERRDDLESAGWEEFDRHPAGEWTTYHFRRRKAGSARRR